MADTLLDFPTWDLPTWNLKEVALIVVFPANELSFLQANHTAVHPSLTPYGTWEAGHNWSDEVLTNRHGSNKSQAETDIPDACPAVLLLSKLPKNGRAYIFGRESRNTELDVALPNRYVSRRQFCVYPNLLHQTWVIQDLSGKSAIVNDSKISSKESDQEPPSRVLQYDRLNRVVLAQTSTYPGITLFIKPVWPKDSHYLLWDWQNIPDLAGLNLCSTLTSLTVTQSRDPELPWSGTSTKYCVLERTAYGIDVFFGQNLETGEMLAAEKFLSEHEAREQFNWRKKLQVNPHFLRVDDLYLLDHSYILTDCPYDAEPLADMIENEHLDGRAAFILLQGILSAILVLFNNDISHGAITSNNILVANLSPRNPRFWLTGFSSARFMPEDKLKESHSADVDMALRTIAEARGDPNYFEDPAANDIFSGFLQASQSKTLSAGEILTEFNTLTCGIVGSVFEQIHLTKVFSIDQFRFRDQVYYWKNDVALIARASLAHNTERSQEAHERVLRAKPSKTLSGKGLLHLEEVEKLFDRLEVGIDVWLGFPTGQKRKRKGQTQQKWRIQIQITYHVPSGMWNLSQLIDAVLPADPLDVGNPVDFVEVGGDTKFEGLYVDFQTFKHACCLLGISPPDPELVDHRINPFRPVSSGNGELVLAEEKLLGTAIFNRSSRILYYSGKEYSEANALQLCTDYNLEGLRLGILRSRDPPQTILDLCQGQPTREFPGSQLQSLTESEPEDMEVSYRCQCVTPVQRQGGPEKPIEEWVSEQTRRRRRQPDINQYKLVDGHLLPVEDYPDAARSSPSCSAILTAAPNPLTASDRNLQQLLTQYLTYAP